MKQYLELLRRIKDEGRYKMDRTGTGCVSIFGHQMRFNLSEGFPLVTTKKVHLKAIICELLWFLRGESNAAWLQEKGVSIWDEWSLKEAVTERKEKSYPAVLKEFEEIFGLDREETRAKLRSMSAEEIEKIFIDNGRSFEYDKVIIPKGELGPVYGVMWRSWPTRDGDRIDQIQELITNLKTKPFSRRHVVSAWNPDLLPDETLSPEENVKLGKQALPPCHALFQFFVEEATLDERLEYVASNKPSLQTEIRKFEETIDGITETLYSIDELLDYNDIPKYRISCQLFQRSADCFLGVPFNIASYALFTMMVAQCVNMIPGEFVWTGGDCHIYANHDEQVALQLSRQPKFLPTMKINPDKKDIFSFEYEDFTLIGYDPHPAIKGEVSK